MQLLRSCCTNFVDFLFYLLLPRNDYCHCFSEEEVENLNFVIFSFLFSTLSLLTFKNLKIEKTISGGSVANSIVGLSQLGNQVGFIGKVSDDKLGIEYEKGLKKDAS